MEIPNYQIAEILEQTADLLEISGADVFRIRAYRNAAQSIRNEPRELYEMSQRGEEFQTIPMVGKSITGKIREIIRTGKLNQLEHLKTQYPISLIELLNIPTLGPQRVHELYTRLGVKDKQDLQKALDQNKLIGLPGFGARLIEKIQDGIEFQEHEKGRFLFKDAETAIEPLLDYLRNLPLIHSDNQVIVAGSYRRRKDTVGDIDILVFTNEGENIIDQFTKFRDAATVISKGKTLGAVILRNGLHVDLRAIRKESRGAALQYFTGSDRHNVAIRELAIEREFKINEYGIFRKKKRIAGSSEEEIYHLLDLEYIVPELRENRGEIQAAQENNLPKLIEINDIQGDLQMHSNYSDGSATIEEMAEYAEGIGHTYIAITDHASHIGVINSMNEEEFIKQMKEIDDVNSKLGGIQILKGIEVDILEDGKLDMSDDLLSQLDVVVCSIHSKFDLPQDQQTERLIRAMDNKYFDILGHPMDRIIGRRNSIEIDFEKIVLAAKERHCVLEINAQPQRMDLNDIQAKQTKDLGVLLSIDTDAHSTTDLDLMKYGIYQARRGWLTSRDAINTYSLEKLQRILKR